ncbi:putative N-formylglutamate amidohydrolase [Novosphingobium chloroacetimidivorans]|uniref:Putative N-formylglutamate amidohydrolase n=1 Tax=Novosphingobium chloroacetimidivorans TaxID=1428314 RepID=A0A7W7K6E0_9SPHN|nr:N-formylglutamate amidohydrolase [Novosphingobium chloroacetimidivorans]MBB4857067.1 putative N-formylglutamate amidohydrolase [Novosphingobium chloroacetimidivorans]
MTEHSGLSEVYRLLGEPQAGGVLVVADHASSRVPDDIALGIAPDLLREHIAVDIGVAGVAERMVRPGTAAFLANVSRLVCDFNRDPDAPGIFPETSDGYPIPGNVLSAAARAARLERFFDPYHTALAAMLEANPPALILSLHSFTPRLASDPAQTRPWQVGVLYNEDDRAARIAIPLLEAEGLVVGDQHPYSGKVLNATMNRHAEALGRPYLGIEIRQDQIGTDEGEALWAERLSAIAATVTLQLV